MSPGAPEPQLEPRSLRERGGRSARWHMSVPNRHIYAKGLALDLLTLGSRTK
ncbi:hypothetical protein GCM10010525_12550 [Glutamicibacter bergerei]